MPSIPTPIFTKLKIPRQLFLKNSYTEIPKNSRPNLVAYTTSQTDGRDVFRKECLKYIKQ